MAVSLVAFIIVYFFVFGAGTVYLQRMMNKAPATPKLGLRDGPIRTAGISPIARTNPDAIAGE